MRNLPAYSFLYYKQLQSLFRLCGQVKTISFESSRYQRPLLANEKYLFYLILLLLLVQQIQSSLQVYKSVYMCFPRAYVEFYKSSRSTGVLPEVTLALFLAQHSPHSMELSVYPTEQIELLAGNRNVTHLKYARYSFNSHMHVCS